MLVTLGVYVSSVSTTQLSPSTCMKECRGLLKLVKQQKFGKNGETKVKSMKTEKVQSMVIREQTDLADFKRTIDHLWNLF